MAVVGNALWGGGRLKLALIDGVLCQYNMTIAGACGDTGVDQNGIWA